MTFNQNNLTYDHSFTVNPNISSFINDSAAIENSFGVALNYFGIERGDIINTLVY